MSSKKNPGISVGGGDHVDLGIFSGVVIDIALMAEDVPLIQEDSSTTRYLSPIDVNYNQFHNLFYFNNGGFSPNTTLANVHPFTSILDNDNKVISDANGKQKKYVLMEELMQHYEEHLEESPACWDVCSRVEFEKKVSAVKSLFDVGVCNVKCSMSLDEFFNSLQAHDIDINPNTGMPTLRAQEKRVIAVVTTKFVSANTGGGDDNGVPDFNVSWPFRIDFRACLREPAGRGFPVAPHGNDSATSPDPCNSRAQNCVTNLQELVDDCADGIYEAAIPDGWAGAQNSTIPSIDLMKALRAGVAKAYADLSNNPSLSDDAVTEIFIQAACSGQVYNAEGEVVTNDDSTDVLDHINGSAPRIPLAQLKAAAAAVRRDAVVAGVDVLPPFDMTLDKGPNNNSKTAHDQTVGKDTGAAGGVGNYYNWRARISGDDSNTQSWGNHTDEVLPTQNTTKSLLGSANVAYAGATPKTCLYNALENHTIYIKDSEGEGENGDIYNLTANALKSTNLDLAEFRAACPAVDVLCVDEFLKHAGKIPETADGDRNLDGSCNDVSNSMIKFDNCQFPLCMIRAPWSCTDWCPGDRYKTEYDSVKWKLVYVGDKVTNCCGSPLYDEELGVLTKVADQREYLPGPGNPGWVWEQQCCECDAEKKGDCEHLVKCPMYKKPSAAGCDPCHPNNAGAVGTQWGGSCGC